MNLKPKKLCVVTDGDKQRFHVLVGRDTKLVAEIIYEQNFSNQPRTKTISAIRAVISAVKHGAGCKLHGVVFSLRTEWP